MGALRILSCLCLATLLGACASEDETEVTSPPAEAASDQVPAMVRAAHEEGFILSAALDAYAAMPEPRIDSEQRFPRAIASLLRGWGVSVAPACAEVGRLADEDKDGIPAAYTAKFDCLEQRPDGRSVFVRGTLSLADLDDQAPRNGFAIEFRDLHAGILEPAMAAEGTAADRIEYGRKVTGTVTFEAVGLRGLATNRDYLIRSGLSIQYFDGARREPVGTSLTLIEGGYAPDPIAQEGWMAGSVRFHGIQALKWHDESWTLWRETDPSAHWNAACRAMDRAATGFDNGDIVVHDADENTLRLRFRSCKRVVESWNGEEL